MIHTVTPKSFHPRRLEPSVRRNLNVGNDSLGTFSTR